ncbi:MAG TPA: cyclodeaminase/cyclohydrolase family protein [Gaiellaceae bacterium]|nr:cyclodeaminase/cyclohydrolase family protein [Gaiellaceae bacterium]
MQGDEYLDLRLGDFLERLGTGKPGSGSASALTVAFAAGLVAMVARKSADSWEDSGGVAAQALALQARAAPLALADAKVWEQALEALEAAREDRASPNGQLEEKLDRSTTVPLQIAETAADTAQLAALAAELGDGTYRPDAAAAAVLAAAGARAAAYLVAVNLTVQEGDPRLTRARASEQTAADAAARAIDFAR